MSFPAAPSHAASGTPDFAARLIAWQATHGRHDLPWQQTRDAYRIWLSEIMLQQTQVGSVIPYYARFLLRFPSVEALAAAPLDAVLENWAGLGYYARARNLHRCARILLAEHGGQFPQDAAHLAELPGIGRSTAAAIAAFAFGQRAAILDGNVKRVLTRCFGIEGFPGTAAIERQLWSLAESLLPATHIEAYTQGLMDLGATRCTRHAPRCAACPLHESCVAQRLGLQAALPGARPKKTVPERACTLLLLTDGQHVLLERRPPSGLWGGLLTLPELKAENAPASGHETAEADAAAQTLAAHLAQRFGCTLLATLPMASLRHAFTHFRLRIQPLHCSVKRSSRLAAEPGWEWLPLTRRDDAALPAPIRKILTRLHD